MYPDLQQFSEELEFFPLENSMKFRPSKTCSRSLYVSLGEINIDTKMEKTSTKSCLFQLSSS